MMEKESRLDTQLLKGFNSPHRIMLELEHDQAGLEENKKFNRKQLVFYLIENLGGKHSENRSFWEKSAKGDEATMGGCSYQRTLPKFKEKGQEVWAGEVIQNMAKKEKIVNVLDIGFGTGRAIGDLLSNRDLAENLSVFAYGAINNMDDKICRDLKEKKVRFVSDKRIDVNSVDDIDYEKVMEGNIVDISAIWALRNLPQMDVVMASKVLYHVEDIPAWNIMLQISSILKKGGYAFLSELKTASRIPFRLDDNDVVKFSKDILGIDIGEPRDVVLGYSGAFQKIKEPEWKVLTGLGINKPYPCP